MGAKILVTAVGSVAGDTVIKQLQQNGYFVVGTDIHPKEWLANSFYVDRFYQISRAAEQNIFIAELLEVCQKEHIEYIIPLTDVEVDILNRYRRRFAQKNIVLCMAEEKTVSVCRDKRASADFLQGICQVIPEISRNHLDQIEAYPVICKKRDGRCSQGLHIFYTGKQLTAFLEESGEEYIIQPMIEGDIVTADVIRDRENNICVAFAREELLRTLNGLGITVKVFHDESLERLCRSIAERLDILGCVNFEFIRDGKGTYYFLECNPRFSGGLNYSVLSGYDFVTNHLKCFQGKVIDGEIFPKEQVIVRKYVEYITER